MAILANSTAKEVSLRFIQNTETDMSMLLKWLTDPEVLQYVYGEDAPWDMEKVRETFSQKTTGESATTACLILYQGKEVGYLQYYPIAEDSYKFNDRATYKKLKAGYGMDMFIGEPALWRKGIGKQAVSILADHLRNNLNVHILCVDPETNNESGIHFWKAVGFDTIDIIENYDDSSSHSFLMVKEI